MKYDLLDDDYTKTHPLAFSYNAKQEKNNAIVNTIFIPPCYVKNIITISKDKYLVQDFCLLPCSKHEMRILISFHQTMIPTFITKYILPLSIMQYFTLQNSRTVVEQDNELLISVSENMKKGSKYYSRIVQPDIAIKRYREEFYEKALVKKDPWFKGFETKDIEDLQ